MKQARNASTGNAVLVCNPETMPSPAAMGSMNRSRGHANTRAKPWRGGVVLLTVVAMGPHYSPGGGNVSPSSTGCGVQPGKS